MGPVRALVYTWTGVGRRYLPAPTALEAAFDDVTVELGDHELDFDLHQLRVAAYERVATSRQAAAT